MELLQVLIFLLSSFVSICFQRILFQLFPDHQIFGLPYFVSPMEAEAQCAYLCAKGIVNAVITDDSDVWRKKKMDGQSIFHKLSIRHFCLVLPVCIETFFRHIKM
jgi:hypothetical protein